MNETDQKKAFEELKAKYEGRWYLIRGDLVQNLIFPKRLLLDIRLFRIGHGNKKEIVPTSIYEYADILFISADNSVSGYLWKDLKLKLEAHNKTLMNQTDFISNQTNLIARVDWSVSDGNVKKKSGHLDFKGLKSTLEARWTWREKWKTYEIIPIILQLTFCTFYTYNSHVSVQSVLENFL